MTERETATISAGGTERLTDAVNDAISRTIAIGGLGGIALIHVLQAPAAFAETLYLGLLFVGAVVAAVVLAAVLSRTSDLRAWEAAGGLAGLILLGYLLSRTSGLPAATDDVGEWTEPLGLASMVVEGLVVCLSAGVLATRRNAARGPVLAVEIERRTVPGTQPGPAGA
jgi:hypothetical protein